MCGPCRRACTGAGHCRDPILGLSPDVGGLSESGYVIVVTPSSIRACIFEGSDASTARSGKLAFRKCPQVARSRSRLVEQSPSVSRHCLRIICFLEQGSESPACKALEAFSVCSCPTWSAARIRELCISLRPGRLMAEGVLSRRNRLGPIKRKTLEISRSFIPRAGGLCGRVATPSLLSSLQL